MMYTVHSYHKFFIDCVKSYKFYCSVFNHFHNSFPEAIKVLYNVLYTPIRDVN